jgi:hypothetical protein
MFTFAAMLAISRASVAEPAQLSSPLLSLALPQSGTAMHESSADPSHKNHDWRSIMRGEALAIFDHNGAGVVHRLWIVPVAHFDPEILSRVIIRMYWDNDRYPSVECPLGAFFGVGFGEQRDYVSLAMDENSGALNSYWPMPFHKHATWTITNGTECPLDLYWNIDYTSLPFLPSEVRHFHAQYRRENPTSRGKNYTILEAKGCGTYVGTALFMAGRNTNFLEGNEMIYVDGASSPTIEGTGTEDYFSSAWYFFHGISSGPYHGVVIKEEHPARISAYRWYIEDPIPFRKSIRFTIEHGKEDQEDADYSSVAYYYLAGPSSEPPALPKDLSPPRMAVQTPIKIPGAVEAELLASSAKATSGFIHVWYTDEDDRNIWSNGQVLGWSPLLSDKEPKLDLELPLNEDGKFAILARFRTLPSGGIVRLIVNGRNIDAPIDLWSPSALGEPKEVSLGVVQLHVGDNPIRVQVIGANSASKGEDVLIDAFVLKPVS